MTTDYWDCFKEVDGCAMCIFSFPLGSAGLMRHERWQGEEMGGWREKSQVSEKGLMIMTGCMMSCGSCELVLELFALICCFNH